MEGWTEDLKLQEELLNYINGEMSDNELSDFETRLKNDPSLSWQLREYRNIMTGIEHWGDQQLMSAIKTAEQDLLSEDFFEHIIQSRKPSVVSLIRNNPVLSLSIAAAICLFLYLGLHFLMPSNQTHETYNKYFELDTYKIENYLSEHKQSGLIPTSEGSDTIGLALEKYKYGNYIMAIDLFENLSAGYKNQALVKYYLSLSYMAISEVGKASPLLKDLCRSGDSEFGEKSCWNYALAEFKIKGYTQQTKVLFEDIAQDPSGVHYQSARDILAQWRK